MKCKNNYQHSKSSRDSAKMSEIEVELSTIVVDKVTDEVTEIE